jgi:hypothetical protein
LAAFFFLFLLNMISLAMITGNCAGYTVRCLDSFDHRHRQGLVRQEQQDISVR